MDFSGLLHRTNLNALEAFITNEIESNDAPSEQSYRERLLEADNKAADFLKARFPVLKEYDEIMSYYYDQTGVIKEVYFEIGLIIGGKIAFEISKKMEELK